LAYPDSILYKVIRPARYTGGEWNSIVKDWDKAALKFALVYPDTYEVGMSNMALPILYEILNNQPDVLAERAFAPWVDMEAALRAEGHPLLSLESKRPLKDFDIIGFSLDYELTYTNVLNILDLAQVPVLAKDRGDSHPIVIAGGSCCLNPEPMADFIDFFVIGDGEEVLLELLDILRGWQENKATRNELLKKVAGVSGVYVPSFYKVDYEPNGMFKGISPIESEAKEVIQRRIIDEMPPPATRPVVPFIEVVHDRGAVEIQRGCARGCRFCQAGILYRPLRQRPQAEVIKAVGELIANCGYDEVSLVSLSTSDYPKIDELVASLARQYKNLALSLPSLRLDSFSLKLLESLPARRKTGLTFAPEAGSERLRRVVNKGTTEERILETASTAFARGWRSLKLYFMLGLPTETMDDIEEIVQLVAKIRTTGKGTKGGLPQVRISLSTFIPKTHTSFQWVAQDSAEALNAKHEVLKAGLRRRGSRLSWRDPEISLLEAALSRGDRRLGKVIYDAWKSGSSFDAWDERFKFQNWLDAFSKNKLEPAFYAQRERSLDENLPWAHIDPGVSIEFLKKEYQRAIKGTETPDCHYNACNACGLERLSAACRKKLGA
jgi:radical SAM family uncharacterized protein